MPSKWFHGFISRIVRCEYIWTILFFIWMGFFPMRVHWWSKTKWFLTIITTIDVRYATVDVWMFLQVGWNQAHFNWNSYGIFFSVSSSNYLEFRAISKSSTTHSTFEFLSCIGKMKFLVLHQCLFIGWHFSTNWTYFGYLNVSHTHVFTKTVLVSWPKISINNVNDFRSFDSRIGIYAWTMLLTNLCICRIVVAVECHARGDDVTYAYLCCSIHCHINRRQSVDLCHDRILCATANSKV